MKLTAAGTLALSGAAITQRECAAKLIEDKISYWQLILLQSQTNGCLYHGDDLPYNLWAWPRNTWFQERLSRHLKVLEIAAHTAK